jgi:hypothetical protein
MTMNSGATRTSAAEHSARTGADDDALTLLVEQALTETESKAARAPLDPAEQFLSHAVAFLRSRPDQGELMHRLATLVGPAAPAETAPEPLAAEHPGQPHA